MRVPCRQTAARVAFADTVRPGSPTTSDSAAILRLAVAADIDAIDALMTHDRPAGADSISTSGR